MITCNSSNLQNMDKATPTNYKLIFPLIPTETSISANNPFVMNIFSAILPSVTLATEELRWQGNKTRHAMEPMEFDVWLVSFVVDSRLENWKLLFEWMSYINNNNDKIAEEHHRYGVDAALIVTDNFQNVVMEIQFIDIWPSMIGEVSFSQREGDVLLESTVNFQYDYFRIRKTGWTDDPIFGFSSSSSSTSSSSSSSSTSSSSRSSSSSQSLIGIERATDDDDARFTDDDDFRITDFSSSSQSSSSSSVSSSSSSSYSSSSLSSSSSSSSQSSSSSSQSSSSFSATPITETWGLNASNDHKQVSPPSQIDTQITDNVPIWNYGNQRWAANGEAGGGGGWVYYTMFKFDFSPSAGDAYIPSGTNIVSATLYLYPTTEFGVGGIGTFPHTSVFYRLLKDWEEGDRLGAIPIPSEQGGCTWEEARTKTGQELSWETDGATGITDISPSASFSIVHDNTSLKWFSVDVTDDIKDMVLNPSNNFGWKIVGDADSSWLFGCRQDSGNTKPYIEITYLP